MRPTTCLLLAAFLVGGAPAVAETPEQKGLRIAQEASDRDEGYGSEIVIGEMILRDRSGASSTRKFEAKGIETGKDSNRTMIVFESPPDIAGTALLTHASGGRDSQWLFLPAVKRVKRISTQNKTSSFAGSEFSYEDLIAPPIERFKYKWLRDESCPNGSGRTCYVMERIPKDRNSGYRLQIVWMDQNDYRIIKADLYDRSGSLAKTLTNRGFKRYNDRYWRPSESIMLNHRTGKSTVMRWTQYRLSAGLSSNDFTRRALERGG